MNPTEQSAKTPSPRTGIFATLCGLLRVRGTGARKAGRRLVLPALATTVAALACTAAPALAAAPEPPKALAPLPVFAAAATLHGVLQPEALAPVEPGAYEFLYKASKTKECEGESHAPASPGISLGGEKEEVSEPVSGLKPGTEYAVCLLVRNSELPTKEAVSLPVVFTTATPEVPEPPTLSVEAPVKATEAVLHGVLDPAALLPTEPGTYEFLYKKSKTTCTGEGTAPVPPGAFAGNPGEPVEAKLEGLSANTEYTVCLRAQYDAGDEALSTPPVTFTTALPPETPKTEPATPFAATTATLHGVLNHGAPGNPGSYEFLYKASATECEGGETSGGSATGAMAEKVEAKVTGLLPSTTYAFCLRAHNAAGEESALAGPVTFSTLPEPPAIEAESSSDVLFTEATVSAQINPEGQQTSYHLDYGTSEAYGQSTPETSLGTGYATGGARVQLSELQAGTTYHYRFVAVNASHETTRGEDRTFTTLPAPPAAGSEHCPKNEAFRTGLSVNLPDCRAYELVTPTDKGPVQDLFGEGAVTSSAIAAPDGERIAMDALSALEPGPSPVLLSSYVFSRTASEWTMTSLTAPGADPNPYTYLFSPDLTHVTFEDLVGWTGLYFPWTEQRFDAGPVGGPYPTIATTPFAGGFTRDRAMGASADFSHVVVSSVDHTLLSATPTGTDAGAQDLYEWVNGGGLRLINVTSSGSLIGTCGAMLGDGVHTGGSELETQTANQAVSADGSKVIFTAGCGGSNLYMRVSETVGGQEESKTLDVSEPEGVTLSQEEEGMPAVYQGASVKGSKVFFTTERALTLDATKSIGHLYEYDTEAPEGKRLKLIFQDEELHAEEFGMVFPSEDGSVAYFYTHRGVVLYRWEAAGGGSVHGIATMQQPQDGGEAPYVTPNGEFFLFFSQRVEGEPRGAGQNELYLYSHAAGSVMCVSCGPGAAPSGEALSPHHFSSYIQTPDRTPEMIPMSNDGRYVFFDSRAALVPKVTNTGFFNVYEWEADGTGACTQSVGCTYLISQGNAQINSDLIGASADGKNVFFGTHAQLVPWDIDAYGDIYDARIEGGLPPPPAGSGACQGDACTSPPAWPNDSTPASSSVSGPGNPVPLLTPPKPKSKPKAKRCAKGKVLKKGRCVKRKPVKRRAKKAAGRAVKHNRGGSK